MKLEKSLGKLNKKLGRKLLSKEASELRKIFNLNIFPEELIKLLKKYEIISQRFSILPEKDPTGIGVEMEWMTPEDQIEEALEFQPGISALSEMYLPIGNCLVGSGDPYFLKLTEGSFNIYRIPHDAINNEELKIDEVEYICLLHELFQYVEK